MRMPGAGFWVSIVMIAALGGAFAAFVGSDEAVGSSADSEQAAAARPAPGDADTAAGGDESDDSCLANSAAIEDIRSQREKLEQTRKELAAREAELKAREQALNDELKRLDQLRDEIARTDELHKQENQEKVAKLIDTLENMNPKAGSQLLSTLDDALAVTAMQGVSTPKLAKIMNLMEPARATRLSELLAGVGPARTTASVDATIQRKSRASSNAGETQGQPAGASQNGSSTTSQNP